MTMIITIGIQNEEKERIIKSPAANERFGVIGGVCPPESLCDLASAQPARAVVSRQPR